MAAKKKKKTPAVVEVDIKKRFKNVKILVESGRPKEAIAYIYLTYTAVVTSKFDKPRMPYQTIREYAITCVNELGQKPESVYPLVRSVEDIIYGGLDPNSNEINKTIVLFSALYKDITGKSFSYSI